jgi:hypothetical protein
MNVNSSAGLLPQISPRALHPALPTLNPACREVLRRKMCIGFNYKGKEK